MAALCKLAAPGCRALRAVGVSSFATLPAKSWSRTALRAATTATNAAPADKKTSSGGTWLFGSLATLAAAGGAGVWLGMWALCSRTPDALVSASHTLLLIVQQHTLRKSSTFLLMLTFAMAHSCAQGVPLKSLRKRYVPCQLYSLYLWTHLARHKMRVAILSTSATTTMIMVRVWILTFVCERPVHLVHTSVQRTCHTSTCIVRATASWNTGMYASPCCLVPKQSVD